ncbi:MAG TPA: hypothetical protein PK098_13205, partial [Phycisphaerales bacterium]|nr:hypothetical protein [Phycisphaerales bacterium]
QIQLGRRTVHRAFLMYPESYCRADLNGDFRVDVQGLLILLGNWGTYSGSACFSPDLRGTGDNPPEDVVDVLDLLFLLAAWGPCPGMDVQVLTLSQHLDEAGLTWQNWQDYYNVMAGTDERAKARWTCWFNNRITQCKNCPVCPNPDPFAH